MNTKKILLITLVLVLTQACNETGPNTGEITSPLECLSFYDTSFGIYALTNWDADHNGCLTFSEAQAVQSLPDNAFAGNTSLQSISDLNSFPNLTMIGNSAFAGCTSLVTADLPNIKTVGNNAFAGCTNLVSVRLPNASSISDSAFEGCTNLTNIVGPVTPMTCTGGALKCSDNSAQVLICMNNQWMTKETCANGCSNGTCISQEPPKTCTKGTLKCSDNNAQVLICMNNQWMTKENCANGCSNGACISTQPPKTCTKGTLKCSDDNAQVLLCKNDKWIALASCANGCA
ncbi:MAG: leucine-rich repeat domain-containing protein, partial [Proteobacteria bacterium]|nr:leucine-rich repeat domain-containing protein [Pseudomonadota bacterium]